MATRRSDPLREFSTRATPQRERADARQVRNSAGGYAFQLDPLARLRRFLTIGTTGGTYYASERELTRENGDALLDLVRERGLEVVAEVVAISEAGRAPRNQPALFALALAIAHGDLDTRRMAAEALPRVARTGTHLMQFLTYARQFRGWGRVLDRAIENWYLNREVSRLAYQVVKYRQREGWTHRDVLRLAKPKAGVDDLARRALFDWVCGRWTEAHVGQHDDLRLVEGYQRAFVERNPNALATYVREYGLSWEMLPTEALNKRVVWEALLETGVPQTALMRQLSRLTNLGLLPDVGGWTNEVVHQLTDAERLRKARVHPLNVLVAQRTYASGRGVRGSQTWTPSRRIVDALDAAFYAAYGAVTPTGKRIRLALDVSGSMGSPAGGLPLSCREVSAAMALVTANVETEYDIVGFTSGNGPSRWGRDRFGSGLSSLTISPRQRLDDVVRTVSSLPFGGTDCSLPMTDAAHSNLEFDAFVVYTDSETWHGPIHPHQALARYREKTGIDARLVVVGIAANDFTIADPSDPGMLDVAGFDTSVPNVISDFVAGNV